MTSMQAPSANAGQELYLVLRDFSERVVILLGDLWPLTQTPNAERLLGVDVLYRRDQDLALLCLRFESQDLTASQQQQMIDLATAAGVAVLDPLRLSEPDRKLFYQRYLRRYAVHIDDHRNPHSALNSLGTLLGLITTGGGPERSLSVNPDDSYLLDDDDENDETRVDSPHKRQGVVQDLPLVLTPRVARGSESENAVEEEEEEEQTGMELGPAGKAFNDGAISQARGKGKRYERMPTIPARPSNSRGSSPHINLPLPPPPVAVAMDPPAVRARMSSPPPMTIGPGESDLLVRVRFQRGDTWMPARLRNLTTKEIRLAASAAPGLGQHLKVAVTVGEHGAMLHGTVVEVVNTERSVDGSTSFRLEFDELDNREHTKLVMLLRAAQSQGMSLTPPPPRRNRRFAISWPVSVVSEGHRFNAAALDISERGLFVATTTLIRANQLVFGIALDRDEARVQGRARVARQVSMDMAQRLGLQTGYGLQIEDLTEADKTRFAAFLLRVRKRSQKHVLVVGEGNRANALSDCFHAAGYAVSKANTVETMLKRTHFESGGPNLAVLDQGSLANDVRDAFLDSFQKHQVPILRLEGQSPQHARNALDQALSV